MQVCIAYAGKSRDDAAIKEVAASFMKGIETQGHSAELVNMYTDEKKLTFFDNIIVIASAINGFGGKIPEVINSFIKRSGQVSGKRSFAYIYKGGLRSQKTLSVLLKSLEGEGMYLKNQDVLKNAGDALAAGKRLNLERNN